MSAAPAIPDVIRRFHQRLSEAGLKSTRQRDAIVERFFREDRHISVEELLDAVRADAPHIGYATVYRTLRLLVEHGFAVPRQFGDGQTRFDPHLSGEEEHDHLICIDCRRVIEFSDPETGPRLAKTAAQLGAFDVTRRRLELYARCTDAACPHRPAKDG